MLSWIGLGILVLAGLVLVLMDNPGEAIGIGDHDLARLASGVAMLIVIGGAVFAGQRGRAGEALKEAITWLGIALVLVAVYTYRHEFTGMGNRILAELVPGVARTVQQPDVDGNGGRVVAITANQGGQFEVETLVNGNHVRMLADTGASAVVLSNSDARRVGIDPDSLNFSVEVSTANGRAFAAHVKLADVVVGGISLRNVDALVSQPGALRISLLGMTYLQRIGSFEISGTQLILRQ